MDINGSTSGLSRHLETHNIKVKKRSLSIISNNPLIDDRSNIKKRKGEQSSILNFCKKPSLKEIVAKLATEENMTINSIATSSFIQEAMLQKGFILPKCPSRVMNLITEFAEDVKQNMIAQIENMLNADVKFSLTIDEWTSLKNRRYLNVLIHHKSGDYFNLGLVYIEKKCDSFEITRLVNNKLQEFKINSATDIIGSTTDGASVMRKYGRENLYEHFLCLNHGIHLADTDVFYKRKCGKIIKNLQFCSTNE